MNERNRKSDRVMMKILKIFSIAMIFSSVARFFFGITFINFYAKAMNMRLIESNAFHVIAFVVTVASAPLQLVAGIVGAANCEEPAFWHRCLIASLAACLMSGLGMAFQIVIGYGVSAVTFVCGILVPGLFAAASLAATVKHAQNSRK